MQLNELKRLRDPLAEDLRRQAQSGPIQATDRHESILTHGYQPVGGAQAGPLHALYRDLEALMHRDGGAAVAERLRLARSLPSEQPGTPLALLLPS